MIRSVVCSQDSQDMECLTTHIAILGQNDKEDTQHELAIQKGCFCDGMFCKFWNQRRCQIAIIESQNMVFRQVSVTCCKISIVWKIFLACRWQNTRYSSS